MSPRLRKFIGMIAILAFCTAYVVAAIMVSERLPEHWAVRGVFYGVVGIVWGFPLFPLIKWMNRP